ncbi:GH92 family glycosyl hydrolase [Actinacidiphila bryophytorum]|uniref:Alpha-1,2-mannosidase n=1 Tax=Actinacidiphila bryophytorum TaxID=1436133 RepID=A0A9W4H7D4_9ACTN|nr:GH92 family glycosyl hydrolase [Actinacidiphila bryophytorum]MBM9437579.1 GH92 family glycosyl hydrolase [Actinacidiphila bryophytorum]CAG7655865.1 Alpha-1,2-mannosidase [Actinacidiphila bryophytorum]
MLPPVLRSRTAGAVSALLLAALGVGGLTSAPAHAATANLTQYVDTFVGSDDSNAPNPVGGGAGGSTYPGAVAPFGGVQFSPDTPTASPSGYRYSDGSIEDFSLTHFDGAGCPNNEDLPLMPITGGVGTSPGSNWTSYASAYTKSNESAAPGYYKNRLDKYGTGVELTATTRTGMARLTYPSTTSAGLLINTGRSATGNRSGSVKISGSEVTGSVTAGGFCGSSKTYQIYFDIRFDRAPSGFGTWNGGTVSAGSTSTSGTNTGAYVTFDTTGNQTVQTKVGLSYVSVAGAQANLTSENNGWDFDATRTAADTAWNTMLNRAQVTGGATADLKKFYTALYHVFQSPNISSDVNGDYRGFDGAVHNSSRPVYQNYSGWDIYRSWAALVALIAPTEAADIAKSMVLDGQQGGLLPKWSQQTNEDFVMTGDPGPIIVSSMYAFGVRDFDTAAALSLMEKASNGGTAQGSPIRGNQGPYTSQHYLSAPSDSLEYSASDFAVAQFAKALGDTASYTTHMTRAQWWRNTFSTESGYVQPRNSDGSWSWPLDPASQSNFTEGNAAQYTWMVPYDFADLINDMGGPATAQQRLDHHFTQVNAGQSLPYYYIGNEPEHGVPWAYNFARHPAGTADAVHKVMTESFTTGAGGLPGNDDLGATSAWYVWAALGMYPATPGADTLAVNGPQFPSVLIQRPGGNITVNSSGSGGYVQGLKVNGTATSHNYLRYPDIAGGGTLDYTMGGSPSGSWGTGAGDVPPSFQDGATPVPTAPALGTNLAQGKPVTASAACATAESADKAVDNSLKNNSKWCSKAANPTLTVDLGSTQTVGSFVVKHAGLGGENTSWNTGAFQIQTSTDNSTWSTAVNVTGNRSSRTYHTVTPRQARYVRLAISAPSNTGGDTAARIYELEVYGQSTGASPHAITGLAGKCVDVANSGTADGTHVQLYDCNGTGAQQWTVGSDGTVQALGKCLDDANSGTADGTVVQLWECNNTNAQKWTVSGKQLVNAAANKCLDVPGSNTANGTQLDVWTCNGGANQQWTVS